MRPRQGSVERTRNLHAGMAHFCTTRCCSVIATALMTPPALPTALRETVQSGTRSCNFGWMRQRRRLLLLDPRRPWIVAGNQHGWDLQGPKYVWCRCLWFTEINMPNATLLQNQEVAEAICEELNKDVKPHMVRELMSVQAMCKKI